jgi:hypothetical protein
MRIDYREDRKGVSLIFESVDELAQQAAKACDGKGFIVDDCLHDTMAEWIGRRGVNSWEAVQRKARETWPEGLAKVQDMMAELESCEIKIPSGKKRRVRLNDTEGEPDVGRFLAGDEMYLRHPMRVSSKKMRRIIVTLTPSANCGSDADSMYWRGVAGAAICETLDRAGYPTELWAWARASNSFPTHLTMTESFIAWRVKDSHEPIDANLLANGVSPWLFRTAVFGAKHLTTHNTEYDNGGVSMGYGQTKNTLNGWEDALPIDDGTIHLAIPGSITTQEGAINAAKRLIETIGDNDAS